MARPRVLISTDIGGNDNDDAQSLIHALLYADRLDYRGFVVTRSDDGGKVNGKATDGAAVIRDILKAYGKDLPNLKAHGDFPSAASLEGKIRKGAHDGKFPGSLTDGAKLIVEEGKKASPGDPLYILTWGPIHDAAAAILSTPQIVPNIRLISIAGLGQDRAQPQAYDALRSAVSKDGAIKPLWWIDIGETLRGMYATESGGTHSGVKALLPWVKANVDGKGALGDLFHDKFTYNITKKLDLGKATDGLKMGDTPSLLYLVGNKNLDDPASGSWGGTFQKDKIGPNIWVDSQKASDKLGPHSGAKSVFEHRDAILKDFATRLDWADKGKGAPTSQAPTPEKPGSKAPSSGKDAGPVPVDFDTGGASKGTVTAPDAKGRVVVFGDELSPDADLLLKSIALGDGDRIAFHNYAPGTFKGVSGGNPLQVNKAGTFAKIDSLVDLQELVATDNGVEASVNLQTDTLTLHIDAPKGGTHDIALVGYGKVFVETWDDGLF